MKRVAILLALLISHPCLSDDTSSGPSWEKIGKDRALEIFKCLSVIKNKEEKFIITAVIPLEVHERRISGAEIEGRSFVVSGIVPEIQNLRGYLKVEVSKYEIEQLVIKLNYGSNYSGGYKIEPREFEGSPITVADEYLWGEECRP